MFASVDVLAVDTDGDGVDDAVDNCTAVANADQRDTNGDGYGNICDADLNNDPAALVNIADLVLFKSAFGSPSPSPDADFDGNGLVNIADLAIFKSLYGKPAGPSCVTNPGGCQVLTPPDIGLDVPQTDFKIMMNYELGMHCTGFEFAYCCVLPVYNSILAQVVKPGHPTVNGTVFPELLEGDPNNGLDALGRQTVVRDRANDGTSFKKYVVKYWHDAQPRNDGRGKAQLSTLISNAEGNSLQAWNTTFDSAKVVNGALQYGDYDGATGALQGDGDLTDPTDNYQNAVWNHLYIYADLEGTIPGGTSAEADKIRLGVSGQPGPFPAVAYPTNCGPAFHPLGPVTDGGAANNCGGFSKGNVLTFSGDKGTVVYTQMKVLENLPIMLTSPDIWEALGLPLTPFEDTIDFFADPGLVDEDSVRPFVAMKAQLYDYDPAAPSGAGAATIGSNGNPVIGFGTAPIDIPNCERCHSNPADGSVIQNSAAEGGGTLVVANSPNNDPALYALVQTEKSYWDAYYGIDTAAGDSDWYSRLKSAAISMLTAHDIQHGTSFAANYPGADVAGVAPQNTRLGHESVICQRCHADNVIAVVKSANCGAANELGTDPCNIGELIPPITEAVHRNHGGVSVGGPIAFTDSLGRDGGCQGCHPAHRSNGDMNGYPITLAGTNKYADGDNRGASGGCFVGRDVHSNPQKDIDGAETPEHLNAVGQYLQANVSNDGNGIWCTNCHNQLGQEMWKAENMEDLVHGVGLNNPRGQPTLTAVASAVGVSEAQAVAWLDPKDSNPLGDFSHAIWDGDPGLCGHAANLLGLAPADPAQDANVATIEINLIGPANCSNAADVNAFAAPGPDCFGTGAPSFYICGSTDGDGDFNVALTASAGNSPFCTTGDCVTAAQATLNGGVHYNGTPSPATLVVDGLGQLAVPVPFSAATDGRDHWLSAGEPHCADCHQAPYVEQSGNINAYPPFNYPRKASLMRYSKGHQNITCQGCHESIHGLYPVTPNTDTTSYAQAAALNADGSHGPLKCGTCHNVNANGIPSWLVASNRWAGGQVGTSFDSAATWAHTYTQEESVLTTTCLNCHGVQGANWANVRVTDSTYLQHASRAQGPRASRQMMDKAEIELTGAVFTSTNGADGVCVGCHNNRSASVSCSDSRWLDHLSLGRVAASTFETVSVNRTGSTCGW